MTFDWPEYIALYQPSMDSAFIMRKFKDHSVMASVTVDQGKSLMPLLAFCREYTCGVCHAYYLPRISLEIEAGGPAPQGRLTVAINGKTALEEPLSFFLPRPEPPDFIEKYPWKTIKKGLLAIVALDEETADPAKRVVGFMLENGSTLEVTLDDLVAEQKTTLKINIPLAEYSTLLPEQEKK